MFNEIKKSINSTLYERAKSPFYGALIISWLIWNWKIIYLTLFINEKKLECNKIEYIEDHLLNFNLQVSYPIISTIIILTIIPFISNGAYYLNLRFKKWRTDKRNEVENKQLLSIEKSIELREAIRNQEIKFEKLLENKNEEITILNQEIVNHRNIKKPEKIKTSIKPKINEQEKEFQKFIISGKINSFIKYSSDDLLKKGLVYKTQIKDLSNAIVFGLIETAPKNIEYVLLTSKGKEFLKWKMLNE